MCIYSSPTGSGKSKTGERYTKPSVEVLEHIIVKECDVPVSVVVVPTDPDILRLTSDAGQPTASGIFLACENIDL